MIELYGLAVWCEQLLVKEVGDKARAADACHHEEGIKCLLGTACCLLTGR